MTAQDDDLPPEAATSKRFAKAFLEISPKLAAEFQHLGQRLEREGRWQYVGDVRKPDGYVLSEFDSHGQELRREQHAVLAKIVALLVSDLQRGHLSAWAREGSPLGGWRAIPASAWRTLTLEDFRAGTFTAPGVTLFDTHVGVPVVEDAPAPSPAARRSETGAPGRPTSMHLVVVKLKERAKAGQLETTVTREAATLATWFRANYPDNASYRKDNREQYPLRLSRAQGKQEQTPEIIISGVFRGSFSWAWVSAPFSHRRHVAPPGIKETPMILSVAPNNAAKGQTQISSDFLEGFISEEDYATRRGVSLRTCQRDRQLRQSPPYVIIGRRIYYRVEAVRDWLLAREQHADRKPSAPRVGNRK